MNFQDHMGCPLPFGRLMNSEEPHQSSWLIGTSNEGLLSPALLLAHQSRQLGAPLFSGLTRGGFVRLDHLGAALSGSRWLITSHRNVEGWTPACVYAAHDRSGELAAALGWEVADVHRAPRCAVPSLCDDLNVEALVLDGMPYFSKSGDDLGRADLATVVVFGPCLVFLSNDLSITLGSAFRYQNKWGKGFCLIVTHAKLLSC